MTHATSPWPKKSRAIKLQLKVMLIAFFDNERLIQREFVLNGQKVKSDFILTF